MWKLTRRQDFFNGQLLRGSESRVWLGGWLSILRGGRTMNEAGFDGGFGLA
jgi:hypothetical protein